MCKCPGARSGCVFLTPDTALFSVPGSISLICLTCSYLLTLFRYAMDSALSCRVLMLNQWHLIAPGLTAPTRTQALHTFRGISAYPCMPKTQRTQSSQSCGSWNHRTAHCGGGASLKEPNEAHDTALTSLANMLPVPNPNCAGNHNLNLTVWCMPTTCFGAKSS
jgi:hypothetical protein